jgi:hypothetical protein
MSDDAASFAQLPRRDTLELLADALGLAPEQRRHLAPTCAARSPRRSAHQPR